MPFNLKVIAAVEKLNYRVTVGDIAVQSGLDLQVAQQELLSLASSAGGHLQVTEMGEVAYLFSRNFRSVLQAKFLKLRLFLWGQKIWKVLFYLIRISFGILLIASICIIAIAIFLIVFATVFSDKDSSDSGNSSGGDGFGGVPVGWLFSDWFYFFSPSPYPREQSTYASPQKSSMNFLEGVFSFLFGDGNPNQNLDERRWQVVGKSIRHNQGSVIAEQIIPFLDEYDKGLSADDAMLPVLLRFNGQPEVSPEGEIIYRFPELQTSIKSDRSVPDSPYLKESFWKFSQASSGQILGAIGLGSINFIGAIALGKLLGSVSLSGFLGFVQVLYPVLIVYGVGFLAIPLGRYFWIQWQNQGISTRNQSRKLLAEELSHLTPLLTQKLDYARQFGCSTLLDDQQLVYTTEKDLLEQEADNQAAIDAEWQKRLDRSTQ
jgi:hypothetical protein